MGKGKITIEVIQLACFLGFWVLAISVVYGAILLGQFIKRIFKIGG